MKRQQSLEVVSPLLVGVGRLFLDKYAGLRALFHRGKRMSWASRGRPK
jgi:hypothetical protein